MVLLPTQTLQAIAKRRRARLGDCIGLESTQQHTDARRSDRLLRARRARPRHRRAAEQRYEVAPFHAWHGFPARAAGLRQAQPSTEGQAGP